MILKIRIRIRQIRILTNFITSLLTDIAVFIIIIECFTVTSLLNLIVMQLNRSA